MTNKYRIIYASSNTPIQNHFVLDEYCNTYDDAMHRCKTLCEEFRNALLDKKNSHIGVWHGGYTLTVNGKKVVRTEVITDEICKHIMGA